MNATDDRAPGALLRQVRMAQNLGVADVARQLKLSVKQVEALEAGDFGRLPGPVFVRGFVRNYARFLQLDAGPLLEAVAAALPKEDPLPVPSSAEVPFRMASPTRWHLYAGVAALIVAGLAAYEFFSAAPEQAAPESTAAKPAVAPAASVAPEVPATPASSARAGQAETAGETRAASDSSVASAEDASQPATGAGERGQPRNQSAGVSASSSQDGPPKSAAREEEFLPTPGERQVHMTFDQASWVEIRDRSGKAIFSQLNAPGTQQLVKGQPPLAVIVGNARGVRLTYDERPVNLALHTKVDVARLTLQ